MRRPGRAARRGLLLLLSSACAIEDPVAERRSADAAGLDTSEPDAAALDASEPDAGPRGPPFGPPSGVALCLCGEGAFSAPLVVEGGALGIDGALGASDRVDAVGLIVGGAATTRAEVRLGASSTVGADLLGDGPIAVDGDLAVGGDLRAAALTVEGRLTQGPAGTRTVAGALQALEELRVPVDPPAPCGCSASRAELVASRAALERAAIPIAPRARLSDGVFRVEGWQGVDRIQVGGEVDLLVDGDVVSDGLDVEISGGELRWWVRGDFSVGRYVGAPLVLLSEAEGTLRLPSGVDVVHLVAPQAELLVEDPLELRGQLLLRRVSAAASLRLTLHPR